MTYYQEEVVHGNMPSGPAFTTHSFEVPVISHPPSSPPPPSTSPPPNWPLSYEVHTLNPGPRARAPRPSALTFSPESPSHIKRAETNYSSPSSRPNGPTSINPFGTPPSTPGTSARSLVLSSNVPSSTIPPAPSTPPPVPPQAEYLTFSTSRVKTDARRPASAPHPPATNVAAAGHSHTLSVPGTDARPSTGSGVPTQRRTRRGRSFLATSTLVSATNVNLTPPTSPPATGDRNSYRDTFSSPPVLASSIKSGTSTPSIRPGSGKQSGINSWHLPSTGNNDADQIYVADYFSGATAHKGIIDDHYASTSSSTISLSSTFNKDKDAPIRPSALLQGKVDKPWLEKKDWRIRASYWITLAMTLLGVAGSVLVCITGYKTTPIITQPLCMVMSDDFDTFDTANTWHQEVDMSGFQNGEFEMTSTSPNNSYVKDGKLYIVPTLTSDVIGVANVFDAYTYNITGCTNTNPDDQGCGAVSNATAGTVINPIMSARITTQKSFSINYGKIEIVAKMPTGDWIWPALWMLPVNNTYGPWPMSGEIDIVNSRGNAPSYPDQGRNYIRSFLNWGPTVTLTRAFKTSGFWFDRRGSFANGYHTYTMEWTSEFLRVYIDSRLKKSLDIRFNTPFFARGDFPPAVRNNTITIPLDNPWEGRGNSAPFDQEFYLIMNVAVGGTDGIFADNVGGKPWIDASHTAMREFALGQDQWYPTWPANHEERGMAIDSVKMWKLC